MSTLAVRSSFLLEFLGGGFRTENGILRWYPMWTKWLNTWVISKSTVVSVGQRTFVDTTLTFYTVPLKISCTLRSNDLFIRLKFYCWVFLLSEDFVRTGILCFCLCPRWCSTLSAEVIEKDGPTGEDTLLLNTSTRHFLWRLWMYYSLVFHLCPSRSNVGVVHHRSRPPRFPLQLSTQLVLFRSFRTIITSPTAGFWSDFRWGRTKGRVSENQSFTCPEVGPWAVTDEPGHAVPPRAAFHRSLLFSVQDEDPHPGRQVSQTRQGSKEFGAGAHRGRARRGTSLRRKSLE